MGNLINWALRVRLPKLRRVEEGQHPHWKYKLVWCLIPTKKKKKKNTSETKLFRWVNMQRFMRQNKQTLARIRTWTSCSDVNELHLAYSVPEHINEQIGHASDNLEISWVAISEIFPLWRREFNLIGYHLHHRKQFFHISAWKLLFPRGKFYIWFFE